jgi:hypothetical protein
MTPAMSIGGKCAPRRAMGGEEPPADDDERHRTHHRQHLRGDPRDDSPRSMMRGTGLAPAEHHTPEARGRAVRACQQGCQPEHGPRDRDHARRADRRRWVRAARGVGQAACSRALPPGGRSATCRSRRARRSRELAAGRRGW